ncbi:MAG: HD domain-containing protein [Spirochaetales bacterium]|nr:HD domain-containing protein [Spirochaetales bacterium]
MPKVDPVLSRCKENNIPFFFENFSALDKYFCVKEAGPYYLITEANIVNLAKTFENIEFPGLATIDARLTSNKKCYYFRCVDNINDSPPHFFGVQNFYYDETKQVFIDTYNNYNDLRHKRLNRCSSSPPTWATVMDAAYLSARYNFKVHIPDLEQKSDSPPPSLLSQKLLLKNILESKYSSQGFEVLKNTNFLKKFWPEIFAMISVPQIKDYHPEGNVWEHALECLKYRKQSEPTLSLALLLHDIGKTVARGDKLKPYQNHSELGVTISYSFLKRLGFSQDLIRDVTFLIRHHMMPAALPTMPLYRISNLLKSTLFPLLLELYRADIESTFRKPDGYYEACRIYRSFLKIENNPYRSAKLGKRVLAQ